MGSSDFRQTVRSDRRWPASGLRTDPERTDERLKAQIQSNNPITVIEKLIHAPHSKSLTGSDGANILRKMSFLRHHRHHHHHAHSVTAGVHLR